MSGTTDRMVQALLLEEPREHAPAFALEEAPEGWWFSDGGRRIAFLHRESLAFDPFEFSPFQNLGREAKAHPCYDMGTRIFMHLSMMTGIGSIFSRRKKIVMLDWRVAPHEIQLQVVQTHPDGAGAESLLTVGYRSEREAYSYDLKVELAEPEPPARREFCNVYVQGLGDGIPSGKRYQYTIWEGHDGRLWKMAQNPCHSFGIRKGGQLLKHLARRGFLGFGVEDDANPVVLFHEANVPLLSATCDMWHDEHLSFTAPGLESWEGGRAVQRAHVELINLPAAAMRPLLDEASPIPIDEVELEKAVPALHWNRTSTMDEALDPRLPYACMVFVPNHDRVVEISPAGGEPGYEWRYRERCGKLAAWSRDEGRGGSGCLQLQGLSEQRVAWLAVGQAFHVAPSRRYRFSAWVRTTGRARAVLRVANIWGNFYEISVQQATEPRRCDNWEELHVEVTTTDYPYLEVWLEVTGDGLASFDDLFIGEAT